MSFGAIIGLLTGSPAKFAISYSLGNILSLFGTGFLIGPKKQWENMKDKERRVSSIVWAVSMICTLTFAFLGISLLVLVFLIT
mmetsp:Transcript_16160/g.2254  ORF Transcript_16160/g.2254 Transcript_16160/m.2254 type:complete len:83 (-) Transcript_16160:121-369(-)